jgi:hypothetical protein
VPLSLDTSFALRPDALAQSRGAGPVQPSESERQQFAGALARAERAEPAAETTTPSAAPTPTLVRATRTPLRGDEAAGALRDAWTTVRGESPSAETLAILVGQWAHETGRGASMLNFNFGGLKGTGPSGLSTACSTREGWGDSQVRVVDRFRAYGSAEEGAQDYVSLLARRYPDAVRAAENGDAKGFVQALKARGYFTDNEAAYTKSVQSLANLALKTGFDAVGADGGVALDGSTLDGGMSPALLEAQALASAEAQSFEGVTPGGMLDPTAHWGGGALIDGPRPSPSDDSWEGLAVPPGAFADEVNRAALLMSALRIAEPRSRRG